MFSLESLGVKLVGVGVLIVALFLGALYIHHKGYTSGRHSQDATIAALRSAANDNQQTIATLKAANKAWADKYAIDLKATKAVADAAIEQAQAEQKKAASARAQLQSIYSHDKEARHWAAERVPDAVAGSLCATAHCTH